MFDSKAQVHWIAAILLLFAVFLAQFALFSQFQKLRKDASLRSSQAQFLLADGGAPPPPPIKL